MEWPGAAHAKGRLERLLLDRETGSNKRIAADLRVDPASCRPGAEGSRRGG